MTKINANDFFASNTNLNFEVVKEVNGDVCRLNAPGCEGRKDDKFVLQPKDIKSYELLKQIVSNNPNKYIKGIGEDQDGRRVVYIAMKPENYNALFMFDETATKIDKPVLLYILREPGEVEKAIKEINQEKTHNPFGEEDGSGAVESSSSSQLVFQLAASKGIAVELIHPRSGGVLAQFSDYFPGVQLSCPDPDAGTEVECSEPQKKTLMIRYKLEADANSNKCEEKSQLISEISTCLSGQKSDLVKKLEKVQAETAILESLSQGIESVTDKLSNQMNNKSNRANLAGDYKKYVEMKAKLENKTEEKLDEAIERLRSSSASSQGENPELAEFRQKHPLLDKFLYAQQELQSSLKAYQALNGDVNLLVARLLPANTDLDRFDPQMMIALVDYFQANPGQLSKIKEKIADQKSQINSLNKQIAKSRAKMDNLINLIKAKGSMN